MQKSLRAQIPPSGWARRRSDVAMRIEDAALRHFLAHGIIGVTVDDLAEAAGISRRTFYRYFGTIDDVLTMMPRRALARIARSMQARPPDEPLREALVNAFKANPPDEGERAIQRLCGRLMKAYPEEWWDVMARVQSVTQEVFETAIAERLRLAGRDPRVAPMIAGGVIAAIAWVAQESLYDESIRSSPETLDVALKDLSDTLA